MVQNVDLYFIFCHVKVLHQVSGWNKAKSRIQFKFPTVEVFSSLTPSMLQR